MRKNYFILLTIFNCIFLQFGLFAQVKTKVYPKGLPKDLIKQIYPFKEINIAAPSNFELLKAGGVNVENPEEYKIKFAEVVDVNYDLLITAKKITSKDRMIYSLKLIAEKAFNISVQFSEFHLSQNTILNIRTDFEITDDITAKENNTNNIWATRIYQGNVLYLTLSVPEKEITEVKIKLNKIGFGFRQVGGGFFGNPGTSGDCNINV